MPYVYILLCADGTYYTGATIDIEERFLKHKKGKGAKYTRGRLPVKIIYSEFCETLSVALKQEKKIQKMSRYQKEQIIQHGFQQNHLDRCE